MACGVGTRLELDGWRSEKKESVSDSGKTGFMAMGYSCEKWLDRQASWPWAIFMRSVSGQMSGRTAMGLICEKCFGTYVWTDMFRRHMGHVHL